MGVAVVVNWTVIKQNWSQDGDMMMQAHGWGKEDALEGEDVRGSAYFVIGSPAWESYNEGYRAGLAVRERLAGASDEINFMHQALDSLRADVNWNSRAGYSESERIGEHFCQNPFLY